MAIDFIGHFIKNFPDHFKSSDCFIKFLLNLFFCQLSQHRLKNITKIFLVVDGSWGYKRAKKALSIAPQVYIIDQLLIMPESKSRLQEPFGDICSNTRVNSSFYTSII